MFTNPEITSGQSAGVIAQIHGCKRGYVSLVLGGEPGRPISRKCLSKLESIHDKMEERVWHVRKTARE